MSAAGSARALLVFDGDCGFCSSAARWITARWTDPGLAALPSQWLEAPELAALGLTAADVARAAWWVEDGRRSRGHRAVARALIAAGGGWSLLGRVLLVPPVSFFAATGYRLVARYRHLLPGGTPACRSGAR